MRILIKSRKIQGIPGFYIFSPKYHFKNLLRNKRYYYKQFRNK